MFVCVLKDPLAASVASDLSLMDIVVGHFGYLGFISSSELEYAFPREIASYARSLVKKARDERESAGQVGHASFTRVPDQPQQLDQPVPNTDVCGTLRDVTA